MRREDGSGFLRPHQHQHQHQLQLQVRRFVEYAGIRQQEANGSGQPRCLVPDEVRNCENEMPRVA
ncbi:hypothetical protein D9M68_826340 [compost metagenome]